MMPTDSKAVTPKSGSEPGSPKMIRPAVVIDNYKSRQ